MIHPIRYSIPVLITATAAMVVPASATAQESAAEVRELRVGDAAVEGTRLSPGSTTLRMIVSQGGQEMEVGTVTEEIRLTTENGRPVIERIQTVVSPMMGTFSDSVVVHRGTLAPIRHRSHNPQRVMALDFDGRKVTGSITPTGGESEPVEAEFDIALFDSNPLDLVIRALPLAEGYGMRIPVYIHELGGKAIVTVRVVGAEEADAGGDRLVDSWKIEVERDGNTGTLWIAKDSREIVRQSVSPAPGVELRMVR